jgi:hypothetical protein
MNTELETLLLELRDAQARVTSVLADEALARRNAIPTEVAHRLADIAEEFAPMVQVAAQAVVNIEARARTCVLVMKEGGKAGGFEATYIQGRTTWDTKGLDKAMKLIPGLAHYRKQGEPYVTLRKAKDESRDDSPSVS